MAKGKKKKLHTLMWPDGRIPAAIYCRVSSRGQDVENSLDAQIARVKEWAEKNGYVIVMIFTDEALSGRTGNRPDFQGLIEVATKDDCPFQVVLVWRFSRFYRNDEESAWYKMHLKKRSIRVVSINETVDETAAGKFAEKVFEAHDAFQSDIISEDVKRGSRRLAERGFFLGAAPPYGMTKIDVTDGKKVRHKLAPDPKTGPYIRRLFDLALENKTDRQVAAALNAEGIPNASGKRWTAKRVHDAANNRHYDGSIVWGLSSETDEPVITPGAHQGIVTPEELAKVQELRAARAHNVVNPRHAGSNHLLSDLVICGDCGAKYTYATAWKKGKTYQYMVCSTRKQESTACCNSPWLPAADFESRTMECILEDILTESNLAHMIEQLRQESGEDHQNLMGDLDRLEQNLGDLQVRQERLYAAYENGVIDLKKYSERNQELREMKDAAHTKRQQTLKSADHQTVVLENPGIVIRYAAELRQFLREEEPTRCRSWLKSFVKWVRVEPGIGTVELRIPTPPDSISPRTTALSFDLAGVVRPSTRLAPPARE